MNKNKSLLDLIKERQSKIHFERAPVSADDWQKFKKNFVEEYGGEKVQDTGMTHSEFIQYLKDSSREGDEFEGRKKLHKLRDFLDSL
jgi:hypothetical protein